MMRKLLVSVSLLVLIIFISACNQDEESNEGNKEMVTAVETATVIQGDLTVDRKVLGRTAAKSMTPVILQAPGEIDAVEVSAGDKVKKDDVIATVKTQMGNQQIKAPKDGEVTDFSAESGDLVSESDPLAMIVNLDDVTINISVTANVRSLLKKEAKLKALIDDQDVEAEVTSVGKIPDETGLYPVEATVKNTDDILPGMIATLYIPEEKVKKSLIVPTAAIVEDGDGAFVYVVKDDHVEKIEVDVKVTQSDQTAIKGEINKDDQVVINGQLTLTDGSQVNVVKEGE